jgi:Flp pilus assembly protein TadG
MRLTTTRRRAATLVEMAIVLGICLLILFGIYEYGRLVMVQQLVQNAAREGARQAVTGTTTLATSDIQNTVTTYLAGVSVQNVNVQVYKVDPDTGANLGDWTSAQFGQGIAVQVTLDYQPVLAPVLGSQAFSLTATSVMRSEAN